jgi:hypothetical protein
MQLDPIVLSALLQYSAEFMPKIFAPGPLKLYLYVIIDNLAMIGSGPGALASKIEQRRRVGSQIFPEEAGFITPASK